MSYARVVPAFEEVSVVEQASGEELSSVGSRPDVGVVEPNQSSRLSKASPGAFKSFLEFYKSLSMVLWFIALSN
jgi:hypothetical protein